MYKFIGLIPRREDVSRAFFAEYYESNHAPLALKYFRGFGKYLRNHIAEELSGSKAQFDVFSEFWYESLEELSKTGMFLESDLAPIIRHDENQFMNQPGLITLTVDELLISGPERCLEPEVQKLIMSVKRQKGLDLDEFREKLIAEVTQQAAKLGAYRVCCSIVQHFDDEAPWDAVLIIWPGEQEIDTDAIPQDFASLMSDHLLVRTRSVETDLENAYQNVKAEQGATCDISI